MKKIFLLLFLFSLIFSCKDDQKNSKMTESSNSTIKIGLAVSSGGLGDQSFNDIQYKGLMDAYQDLDIEITYHVAKGDNYDEYLNAYKYLIEEEKCNMIIAGGFEWSNVINDIAGDHPDVYFLLNDTPLNYQANTASILYAQHEGSFVIGALSAMMTKHSKLGFIGGVDIDVVKEFYSGFVQGAKYINKDIVVENVYLSNFPDFSGFSNPDKGNKIALDMYKNDIDIIYSVAGGSGNGIIEAAKSNEKYVIGVDTDQDHMAKGYVLTSMLKRLDIAIYDVIKKHLNNQFEWGKEYTYGYKNGGISISEMKYTKHLFSSDILDKIKEIEAKITNSEIKIEKNL